MSRAQPGRSLYENTAPQQAQGRVCANWSFNKWNPRGFTGQANHQSLLLAYAVSSCLCTLTDTGLYRTTLFCMVSDRRSGGGLSFVVWFGRTDRRRHFRAAQVFKPLPYFVAPALLVAKTALAIWTVHSEEYQHLAQSTPQSHILPRREQDSYTENRSPVSTSVASGRGASSEGNHTSR